MKKKELPSARSAPSAEREQSRLAARAPARTGGKANQLRVAGGARKTSKKEEASRLEIHSGESAGTTISTKEAGLPSRCGCGGSRQHWEMSPPCQIGRSVALPGLPTQKKEPTPMGRRIKVTRPIENMRRTVCKYSGISRLLMRILLTPTDREGKILLISRSACRMAGWTQRSGAQLEA